MYPYTSSSRAQIFSIASPKESQDLVYDLKPYIDENGLQDAVGLNYTQHDMDGHIYAVHDQIESRGLWYNSATAYIYQIREGTASNLCTYNVISVFYSDWFECN